MTVISDKCMTPVQISPGDTNRLRTNPLFAVSKLTAQCIHRLCWSHMTPSDILIFRKHSTLHQHVYEENADGKQCFPSLRTIYFYRKLNRLLGTFTKLPKATASFIMSVRLSARMKQLGSHSRISNKFSIWVFFENLSRKFKFHYPFKDEGQTALFKYLVRTAL
jgi:hypothetical protein